MIFVTDMHVFQSPQPGTVTRSVTFPATKAAKSFHESKQVTADITPEPKSVAPFYTDLTHEKNECSNMFSIAVIETVSVAPG